MVAAWSMFYGTAAGAAAALTGLIFVAITLHERSIIGNSSNRDRAWASIALLTSVLVISMAEIMPSQSERALGIEVAPFAAYWAYRTLFVIRAFGAVERDRERPRGVIWQLEWIFGFAPILALIAGAAALVAENDLGLPSIAFAALGMIGFAIWNAWVLISEISG